MKKVNETKSWLVKWVVEREWVVAGKVDNAHNRVVEHHVSVVGVAG